MYTTPKKRLFELKKELKAVKKKMDKLNKYLTNKDLPLCSYGLEKDTNWNTWEIILSNGTEYDIDGTTTTFPDIDFKKVVYINKTFATQYWKSKKTGKMCNNVSWHNAYDSITGFYNGRKNYEYPKMIREKFNVTNYIYTGED